MIVIVIIISADDPKQEEMQNRVTTEQAKETEEVQGNKSIKFKVNVFYTLWCPLKDGAYYCYCAYVLRISKYSDFLSPMLTNTGIFFAVKVDLSNYSWYPK